jgi:two-component system OmpR family sensor kinase
MLDEIQETVARREQSEQMTRQFAADASHELKSPLTVISGYVDVLLRGGADDAAARERALIGIQREASRMTRLVSDLLALAQLEAGGLPMQREEIDLAVFVREVYGEARQRSENRRFVLDMHSDEHAMVRADRDGLARAMRNLIDNAVRHTDEGGEITLGLRAEARSAVILVSDDGNGIEAAHLPHVFERFYRADPARSHDGAGSTGLGLAITRALVEAHGGEVGVASTAGQGAVFTIRLPLVAPAAQVDVPAGERAAPEPAGEASAATFRGYVK